MTTTTTTAALQVTGLRKSFGDTVALDGIDLNVDAGSVFALLGPNGAGKTTLLRVLAGLLRPHAGEATVLGAELPREAWKLRGKVGFLAHDPLLYRELSPRENLRFQARLYDVAPERVDAVLEAVGMLARADDPVSELSRGMVQRVAAARAVLHDPPLLLLDEPWAGLDPGAVELLDPLIGPASGKTRVVVTHDVSRGVAEADVTLGLRDGREAPAGELYR